MREETKTSYLGVTIIVHGVGFTVLDRDGAVIKQCGSIAAARSAIRELRRAEKEANRDG